MTVIDLFCGCGGISLGFQMAGHKIIYGLDNKRDPIETFKRNFPSAKADCNKIEDIDVDSIPSSDIIVGGPPCVNFSSAKGSRANVLEGIKLVQAFLRIIYHRKPKYWIMENVPRIGLHLPESIPLRWIGIDEDGELEVPQKKEFDISLYGAPQKRKRLLIGRYPIPTPTFIPLYGLSLFEGSSRSVKTLGDVVTKLPDPLGKPMSRDVEDPNYPIILKDANLTDHFMDTTMTDQEAGRIEVAKLRHPYMGRMDFPDDISKPARTVVALQMGRETLVLRARPGKYRRATVRECATLQTFPISFQFGGRTIDSRYRQAGNAVPPILAYQIALEIMREECPESLPITPNITYPEPFGPALERMKAHKRDNNFAASRTIRIPYKEVRGTRVELTSHGYPETRWETRLHLGEGKDKHLIIQYPLQDAILMAKASLGRCGCDEALENLGRIMQQVDRIKVESSNEVHEAMHRLRGYPPCIRQIEDQFESIFPSKDYSLVDVKVREPIKGFTKKKMRFRLILAMVLLKRLEMKLNCEI